MAFDAPRFLTPTHEMAEWESAESLHVEIESLKFGLLLFWNWVCVIFTSHSSYWLKSADPLAWYIFLYMKIITQRYWSIHLIIPNIFRNLVWHWCVGTKSWSMWVWPDSEWWWCNSIFLPRQIRYYFQSKHVLKRGLGKIMFSTEFSLGLPA